MTTGATIHTSAGLLMSVNRRRTASSDNAEVSGGVMNGISRASEVVDDKNIPIVLSP